MTKKSFFRNLDIDVDVPFYPSKFDKDYLLFLSRPTVLRQLPSYLSSLIILPFFIILFPREIIEI